MQASALTQESTVHTRTLRVALVCMPFYAAGTPSIQIGLLSALARREGCVADTYHLNVELAARLTPEVYEILCNHRGRMTGDWLFSVAAFGERAPRDAAAFYAEFPGDVANLNSVISKDEAYLTALRHEILPAFIEDCLQTTDWGAYDLVGFTSTFQQNVASLALARRIKETYPSVKVVFGGANFEDEMGLEYMRSFSFIDYAVVGEGDITFPALLQALSRDLRPEHLPGLIVRGDESLSSGGQAPPVRNLDDLPTPCYDEYFDRAQRLQLTGHPFYPPSLPFESSRGCWWGQKHHCTFCGLNGLGMSYRAKQPARAMRELNELARRHRVTQFAVVDNILDMKYVHDFFSEIEQNRHDYTFFYEVKANLTREQLRLLHNGGVRRIQPGIESLSSEVLQLMNKGCTMLQNVRFLKWALYYRMHVSWNLLWRFPGEQAEYYINELDVLRKISHLQPPLGCGGIWLERFSPYYVNQDSYPICDIRPEASYYHVYPRDVRVEKVAYFFDYSMGETLPDEAHAETQRLVGEWQERWKSLSMHSMQFRRTPDSLFVDVDRGPERKGTYTFEGALAALYEYCSDTYRSVAQATEHLRSLPEGKDASEGDVAWALEEFCRRDLMIGEDGKYLSLALPAYQSM